MQDRGELDSVIQRVQQMEAYFDTIETAMRTNPDRVWENAAVREMLQALIRYYESGEWLEDYARDERGELPTELKRGVLSQDAVYNLLCELKLPTEP